LYQELICVGVFGAGVGSFRVSATGNNLTELRKQVGTSAAVRNKDQEVQAQKEADDLLKNEMAALEGRWMMI
jgi:hypothetical protein